MSVFIETLKSVLLGIVQGITEWLPVSSTGHMILLDKFISLDLSEDFKSLFFVVIQLGSILAVLVLYWQRLFPFSRSKSKEEKSRIYRLWLKVIVASVPVAVVGFLLDDWCDTNLYNYIVVAAALIVYGVAFIVLERLRGGKTPKIASVDDIDYKTAFFIGCFQTLSIVPGTSRSGSTILGASLLGVSRVAAAEFSFFMAIPAMLGASGLKTLKFALRGAEGFGLTAALTLAVGTAVAFVVSMFAIRFLIDFVKRHSFEPFGWYRVILGAAVLVYFAIAG